RHDHANEYSDLVPIPPFDANLVLPPHLGDPTEPADLSPYPCTILEVCQRFTTSRDRAAILQGLLQLRAVLGQAAFTDGFQWLAGSFIEDIEKSAARSPNDVDVITFYDGLNLGQLNAAMVAFPVLYDPNQIKATYRVDHFFVDMA